MNTDTRHLGPDDIAGYHRRTLPPADLLRVDDHVARCDACRNRIAGRERVGPAAAAIRLDLAEAAAAEEHPPIERIAIFVDGGLEEIERELIDVHLETCRRCAEDVADLRALREELQPSGARLGARTRPGWRGYAGMTLVAAGLAGVLVWTSLGREAQPERDAASTDPAVGAAPATRAPVPRLVLRDGNETVTIDADGTLSGVPGLREEETRLVRQVLEEGRLRVPPFISALAGSSGTLMSGPPDPATFGPLRPLATAVESDRPQFEWTPLDRATAYVISVFDQNFDRITESPPLTEVRWRPAAALARGRTYQWQVRASVGDREIVAPAPPASEARFRVLSRAEADRLAEARRRLTGDLALGILLARAGVLDEAHDAFRRLATANPTSREPRMLLEDIRARRPGTARHDSGGGDQRPSPMSTNPAQ